MTKLSNSPNIALKNFRFFIKSPFHFLETRERERESNHDDHKVLGLITRYGVLAFATPPRVASQNILGNGAFVVLSIIYSISEK